MRMATRYAPAGTVATKSSDPHRRPDPDRNPVGWSGATAATLKFGPLDAESVVVNKTGTKITAYTPAEPVSTVNVTVTTPGGTFTLTNGYTFI